MTFMPWSKDLEIGIEEIDKQHRWLFELTNRLHKIINNNETQHPEIQHALEQLVDYTMNHFIIEEELFERLGYPETDAHKAQHNVFCHNVMDLLIRHDSGEVVNTEMLKLLKDWLLHHICAVDKAYVAHFRAHKVAPDPLTPEPKPVN